MPSYEKALSWGVSFSASARVLAKQKKRGSSPKFKEA